MKGPSIPPCASAWNEPINSAGNAGLPWQHQRRDEKFSTTISGVSLPANFLRTIVASHEKGLTATDQLRTVARQCYAWTLPYGVSFAEDQDVKNGKITSNALKQRLEMLTRDARVTGNSWPANAARTCAGLNRATWRVTDESLLPNRASQKLIEACRGFRLI